MGFADGAGQMRGSRLWFTASGPADPMKRGTSDMWILNLNRLSSVAHLRVPAFVPSLGLAACIVVLSRPILRRRALSRSGQCLTCGYDLTGNVSGVCPECGTIVEAFSTETS